MGVDDLFFVDDTITINKKNLIDTCSLIVERGLNIHYKISARVDTINEEVLQALKKSGCYRIHFGIESASPRHLKYLQKGQTPEKIERACKMTRKAGIGFFAYMMIGIPHETKEEMFATVDFTKNLKPDYAQFSICTPYPKTELYFRMLEEGILPGDYWQSFAENPTPEFKIRFFNKDFDDEELRQLQDECHARQRGADDARAQAENVDVIALLQTGEICEGTDRTRVRGELDAGPQVHEKHADPSDDQQPDGDCPPRSSTFCVGRNPVHSVVSTC